MAEREPIDYWTRSEVLAMLDRQGWPTIDSFTGSELRLLQPGQFVAVICGKGAVADALRDGQRYPLNVVGDEIALALLRDDSRQRLEKAGMSVREEADQLGKYRVMRRCPKDCGVWKPVHTGGVVLCGMDYDTALIFGRRATEGLGP